MIPTDGLISEQQLQMKMMMLNAKHIECLTDGEATEDGVVFNCIEVLSDDVTLTTLYQYEPQTRTFVEQPIMHTLKVGVYLGYFKDMIISVGQVRIAIW